MPRSAQAAFLIACLAACEPEVPDEPAAPAATETAAEATATSTSTERSQAETTQAPGSTDADDSDCGADKVAPRWLNALPTDDVKQEIVATVGERPIRYYAQGDPITMDFNPARLNVELGEDGRIKVFRCG